MLQFVVLGFFGALSLAAALFHRAVASASPARLEEINEERGTYPFLPDINDARAASGLLKVAAYAALASQLAVLAVGKAPPGAPSYLAAVLLSGTVLVLFEAVALVTAGYHTGRTLHRLVPLVSVFAAVGQALLAGAAAAAGFLAKLAGGQAPPPPEEAAEEEMLDAVSEGERQGVIEDREREMIESIIEFKDVAVSEIMTPRTEMTTAFAEASLRETLASAVESGHSRLPVWSENADNIVGVLYVKDMLQFMEPERINPSVRSVMREPYFVPETKMIRELLQEFRARNVHMAIVLDEYGGTSGIVTIEDIIEEIVGEIADEFDEYEPPEIRITAPGRAVVAGSAGIDEINQKLGARISENEEYETVAGYVLFRIGRIPRPGETFEWEGARFSILEADQRRIRRLAVDVSAPHRGAGRSRGI